MRFAVVDILTYTYIIAVALMIIATNVKPFFLNNYNPTISQPEGMNKTENKTSNNLDLDEDIRQLMVYNQIIISVLSILGNSFTIVSLPYARRKYGLEFSILQLNSVILMLHLSLCDLLYSIIGFPHLIHAYLYMTNVYSDGVCYFLGMFRNLVAYTDFNTIAVISCCVARQTLCRECSGNNLKHDQHDKIFGGNRIYLVCLSTWIVSALILLPDIIGWTGYFGWTGSAYACDNVTNYDECSNVGPFINLTLNFCVIIIFYSYIVIKMIVTRLRSFEAYTETQDEHFKSISLTMLMLTLVYLAFLFPIASPCSPGPYRFETTKERAVIANWYWWTYAINFFVYFFTSKRIRAAYIRCCKDALGLLTSTARNITTDREDRDEEEFSPSVEHEL